MSRPSLQIALDPPAGPFPCGARITGVVTVTVEEACPASHLVAAVGYRATGAAPNQAVRNWKHSETLELFAGSWQPGTHRFPFSVTAPDGCNYAGTIMTLAWYVRADIRTRPAAPFDVVSELEQPIDLGPSPVSTADRARRDASECLRNSSTKAPRGCLPTALVLLVGGAVATWLGADHDAALPGVVAVVIGLGLLGLVVRQALVGRKVTRTGLRVGSTVVWPGLTIPCTVTLEPKAALEIERGVVTLEGWEHVKKFTGLNRTTGPVNTHSVHSREFPLTPVSEWVPAGAPVQLSATVEIPPDAVCTFDLDREVKFRWRLVFSVRVKGCPEWFDAAELTVLPRAERRD
jgi:hypothetical protein